MEFVLKISKPKPRPWASKNSHSKEQEMKIILSTFNLSTPEARWSRNWRLCDRLHWSLLNQSVAIFVPAEVIQKICSLWRFSSWKRYLSRISTRSILAQCEFNVKFCSNPNCSRWSHLLKIHMFILMLWRNRRLKLKPSSHWRLTRRASYFLGGACWVN